MEKTLFRNIPKHVFFSLELLLKKLFFGSGDVCECIRVEEEKGRPETLVLLFSKNK
jgi:hypothetical protein